ncbi:hypothetical protein IEQ34_022849 [Dendrobium chrysotoxum]|uniref:Uncharacterized protein n=1 Tax=Dendrobium chrysotoxum TaxID=161865 RepID=A0AAV7FYX3_DENCH|nr:hypothetical protein IEQ34_022849 [Dendrobium chrysotoxum]
MTVKKPTLVASCFRGAFPPVDFRAVCFVRAIDEDKIRLGFFSIRGSERRNEILVVRGGRIYERYL